jgi:hypothetical protein
MNELPNRRSFLSGTAATLTAGLCGSLLIPQPAQADSAELNILGPRPGYSPQVGTFVSMLNWMREANGVLTATKGLTQADLDVLFDKNANTIGALMLHLAATETYYQMNTFDGKKWDSWSDAVKQQWDPAMNLGDAGRKTIKGHDRAYYVEILQQVRAKSLEEFRNRDDAWLMAVDKEWPWGPTGQIALLRKRLPGAKPDAT